VIFLYSVPRLMGDKPVAKNNKYFQRRCEFIDYLQNTTYCNMHAAFLHHPQCTVSYSQPIFADRNVHSFSGKILWSTNPTPMTTDCFDRTCIVVVMQLNECHELPVTQSNIGSPHMGEGSTCLHGRRVKEAGL
jgi:hypothetical protein